MRWHMSLRTRFMLYVVFLLILLATLIIFIVEQREVNAIFEEHKKEGVLRAKNIAQLNLQGFLQY
ncbi:MAG: HAMP domain-containing histidine kinase, partial [Candidatus Aminicenantaceae bacterium]